MKSSETRSAHEWVCKNFAGKGLPPFSFVYGGKTSDSLLPTWKMVQKEKRRYDVTFEDTPEELIIKGGKVVVEIPVAPGSAILYYERAK